MQILTATKSKFTSFLLFLVISQVVRAEPITFEYQFSNASFSQTLESVFSGNIRPLESVASLSEPPAVCSDCASGKFSITVDANLLRDSIASGSFYSLSNLATNVELVIGDFANASYDTLNYSINGIISGNGSNFQLFVDTPLSFSYTFLGSYPSLPIWNFQGRGLSFYVQTQLDTFDSILHTGGSRSIDVFSSRVGSVTPFIVPNNGYDLTGGDFLYLTASIGGEPDESLRVYYPVSEPSALLLLLTGILAVASTRTLTGKGRMNRPGIELTPRSWTVTMPPVRRCFSAGISLG